jgi:hypothetical protein
MVRNFLQLCCTLCTAQASHNKPTKPAAGARQGLLSRK